jgi:signal transduction histidine kinase
LSDSRVSEEGKKIRVLQVDDDSSLLDISNCAREMLLEPTKYLAQNLVDEVIGMIKVSNRIKIINNVHDGIWINADKTFRVFINLLEKAIYAIPDRGLVEINSCQLKDSIEINLQTLCGYS